MTDLYAETDPDIVLRIQSPERAERLRALGQLSRTKTLAPAVVRQVADGLRGLSPTDREAALRLGILEDHPEKAAADGVAHWILEALARPVETDPARAKSLALAAQVAARGAKTADDALIALAQEDDINLARVALKAAVARPNFQAANQVDRLLPLLLRPDLECLMAVLALLERSGAQKAVGPIIESMERFDAANPRSGAPDHARALQRLTGQKLGDRPGPWRQWWSNQP